MDNAQTEEPDHPAWIRLKAMHARGDFDKIDRMVQYFDSVETLGRAGEMLRKTVVMAGKVVLWFSGLIGAWLLLSGQLTKYLGR